MVKIIAEIVSGSRTMLAEKYNCDKVLMGGKALRERIDSYCSRATIKAPDSKMTQLDRKKKTSGNENKTGAN